MDAVNRSLVGEYGELLKEWCISAFCSATLDWIASKIPVRNGIFATLLSIGQLTCAFMAINMFNGFVGAEGLLHITDNWLAYNTIIIMSPTAVSRLTNSYMKLHFILYGPGKIPQGTTSCASGNCEAPPVTQEKVSVQRELAQSLPKSQDLTMNERIAMQWKSKKQ